jgi:hypothetical protein
MAGAGQPLGIEEAAILRLTDEPLATIARLLADVIRFGSFPSGEYFTAPVRSFSAVADLVLSDSLAERPEVRIRGISRKEFLLFVAVLALFHVKPSAERRESATVLTILSHQIFSSVKLSKGFRNNQTDIDSLVTSPFLSFLCSFRSGGALMSTHAIMNIFGALREVGCMWQSLANQPLLPCLLRQIDIRCEREWIRRILLGINGGRSVFLFLLSKTALSRGLPWRFDCFSQIPERVLLDFSTEHFPQCDSNFMELYVFDHGQATRRSPPSGRPFLEESGNAVRNPSALGTAI